MKVKNRRESELATSRKRLSKRDIANLFVITPDPQLGDSVYWEVAVRTVRNMSYLDAYGSDSYDVVETFYGPTGDEEAKAFVKSCGKKRLTEV